MGIHDLNKLLHKYCEDAFVERQLKYYERKKLAIDISTYIFKYKAVMGDRWLSGIVEMLASLRASGVHPIVVYDNTPPKAKDATKLKRREAREKTEENVDKLEQDIEEYHNSGEISQLLLDFYKKRVVREEKEGKIKRLLERGVGKDINIIFVENEVNKMKQGMIGISKEDISLTKELVKKMGINWILAKTEAEKECAEMCKSNLVSGVISEDTDTLAYGAPIVLTKFTTKYSGGGIEVNLEKVLSGLGLEYSSFLDLCIMCGTDYNKNMKGIGVMTAYALIKKYGKIEEIKSSGKRKISEKDKEVLNYEECRRLFRTRKSDIIVKWCKIPNMNRLKEWLLINNVRINFERIKECLSEYSLKVD